MTAPSPAPSRPSPIPNCSIMTARFAGALRGLGVAKGDRVIIYMPMIPQAVVAMLACARLGAVHSVVFGGFAAARAGDPHQRQQAQGHRHRVLRHRGQQASSSTSRCSTPPSTIADHKPDHVVVFQRPQATAEPWSSRATSIGKAVTGAAAPADVRAGRSDRSALYPLHLRHDRPAQGRRPRQRRPCGGAEVDDEQHVRHQAGRGVLGRLRRRLGGRPFLYRLRAAAARRHDRRCSRASRSAPPMPAPSGG